MSTGISTGIEAMGGTGEGFEEIAEMLGRSSSRMKKTGPGAWGFTLASGNGLGRSFRLAGEARLEESWLQLEAPLKARPRAPEVWDLARRGGELEGVARFALSGGPGSCSLRADLPLSSNGALEPLLQETCRGLRHGVSIWRGRAKPEAPGARAEGAALDGLEDEAAATEVESQLGALCREAGWSSREREGGGRYVDLEAERGVYRAALTPREGGGASAVAELARFGPLEPEARRAVAVLLLTASGAVRLARPLMHESEEETVVLAEVQLTGPIRVGPLHQVLGALSTFGWLCGPEITALSEPTLADAYLEMRGWSPRLR